MMSDQCVEVSPLHSDPDNTQVMCSPPQIQDSGRPASAAFSPQAGSQITLPESSVPQTAAPQPQAQYQVSHQLQASQALFAQNQVQLQSSVPQPPPQVQASVSQTKVQPSVSQVQVQLSVSQPQPSAHISPSPLRVSVPQQQPAPTAASATLSKGRDDSAVQQHTQNSEFSRRTTRTELLVCLTLNCFFFLSEPTAALAMESKTFTVDVHPPSPAAQEVQVHTPPAPMECTPIQTSQPTTNTKVRQK